MATVVKRNFKILLTFEFRELAVDLIPQHFDNVLELVVGMLELPYCRPGVHLCDEPCGILLHWTGLVFSSNIRLALNHKQKV